MRIDASASASPSPKLLLPKLRPNSSAETHAESRFGVSLLIVLVHQNITHNFSKSIDPSHFDMTVLSRCNHTIIRYKCKIDYLDKDLFCFCEFLAMDPLVCGVHIWQAGMWSLLMVTRGTKR